MIKFNLRGVQEIKNSLGYLNYEQENYNLSSDYFYTVIKASASELCIKFLPLWEQNTSIYKEIKNLTLLKYDSNSYLIGKYIEWEMNFFKASWLWAQY